jgi:phosphoribosylglycinamide formyltransferase-1
MFKQTTVAIFASGGGSNADKIIEQCNADVQSNLKIKLIVCNKENAGVINIAKKHGIPCFVWKNKSIKEDIGFSIFLKNNGIEGIVLAGFLQKIPDYLIAQFPDKIINIHPSLLPKYGGKGMYGMHVHEAVFNAGEKKSGITIHLVNAEYDQGKILYQEEVNIETCKSAKEITDKVLSLEHKNYYKVIMNYFQ